MLISMVLTAFMLYLWIFFSTVCSMILFIPPKYMKQLETYRMLQKGNNWSQ